MEDKSKSVEIGGRPVERLICNDPFSEDRTSFLDAIVAPGRGMNLLAVRAHLPGKGAVDVLHTLPLGAAEKFLDDDDDASGTNAFRIGCAILLPWANRIRGRLSEDGRKIEVAIGGRPRYLDANWSGEREGAERHAIHGLLLRAPFEVIERRDESGTAVLKGKFSGGDFGGRWLSQLDSYVKYRLGRNALDIRIEARNVGTEPCPVGMGVHPYFSLPSGNREQARLRLPIAARALVNNYDDVFPTGELESVKGSAYDFTIKGGAALGSMYVDDMFTDVQFDASGRATAEIVDPAANYGLRMSTDSRSVNAFQVYAVPGKAFIAAEAQTNWNDPFNPIWTGRDTGMQLLQPGESTTLSVRFELFLPR
jgi:galactose mutarotase-like enzyme